MSDPGVATYVRYWLHYSNLAASFFKQFGSAKSIKDDYERQIINQLQMNNMEKAVIQINNGQIRVIDKRESHPLSLAKVEELLHMYYKHKGGRDEALEIMTFIRSNRGYAVNKVLKQTGMDHKKPTVAPSVGSNLQLGV